MTPRALDVSTVQAKLRLMRDLVDDLSTAGEPDATRLREQRLLLRAIERVLTQLVDLSVAVNSHIVATTTGRAPTSYRESFSLAAEAGLIDSGLAAALQQAVGMRNLLVRDYVAIDVHRVASAIPLAREQFDRYIHDVATWISDQ
ncbi:MAG: type VII toxin-antitoxin system HepT family RNase toxin [Geodermatophilaceae bacterium]